MQGTLSQVMSMQSSATGDADSRKAHVIREAALCEEDNSISAEIEGHRLSASISVHTHGDQQASV